jgi:cytochrome b561
MWWRAIFPPPNGPEMPIWMKLGARLGHWTIYTLLVVVPLTAILGAGFEGHPLAVLAVGYID